MIAREFPEREDPGVMTAFIGRAELGPQCMNCMRWRTETPHLVVTED
jgi:hypothetical protein